MEFEKPKNRKEAAEFLGISVVTLDRKVKEKELACFRIGNRILFGNNHLQDFLKKNEQKVK